MALNSGSLCTGALFELPVRSRLASRRAPMQPRPVVGRPRPRGALPSKLPNDEPILEQIPPLQALADLFVANLFQDAIECIADAAVDDFECEVDFEDIEEHEAFDYELQDDFEEVLSLCSDDEDQETEMEAAVHLSMALQFARNAVAAGLIVKMQEEQSPSENTVAEIEEFKVQNEPIAPACAAVAPPVQERKVTSWQMRPSVGSWLMLPIEQDEQIVAVLLATAQPEQKPQEESVVAIAPSTWASLPSALPALKLRTLARNPSAPTLACSAAGSLRKVQKDSFTCARMDMGDFGCTKFSMCGAKKSGMGSTLNSAVSAMALDLGGSPQSATRLATPPARSSSVGALHGVKLVKRLKQESSFLPMLQSGSGAMDWNLLRPGPRPTRIWAGIA